MPYYNCCVSGCTNNFRNVEKLPIDAIFGILFIFCPSKQATRPSPLLDWEMANCKTALQYNVLNGAQQAGGETGGLGPKDRSEGARIRLKRSEWED
jgi:hypothetical protein